MIDNINIGKVWYLFSILPIALMVSNIYIIPISYANIRVGKVYAKGFIITIFELALYLIVFILFYIFSKTTIEKTKLTERNNIFEIQKSYTESLQSYIKYTSKARHDFKHSVHVMSRLADEGNLSALKDYIAQYENSLTVTHLCESAKVTHSMLCSITIVSRRLRTMLTLTGGLICPTNREFLMLTSAVFSATYLKTN